MKNLHGADALAERALEASPGLTLITSPRSTRLLRGSDRLATVTIARSDHADAPRFGRSVTITTFERAIEASPAHVALTLYGALQRARVVERTAVVSGSETLPQSTAQLLKMEPLLGTDMLAARLDIALMNLARTFEASLPIAPTLYVSEVEETVQEHVREAFQSGFFSSVGRGALSREQYVYVMSQQHAYVRYTTRILGYCVAYAGSSELRRHFSKHLSEEINHEKIIESDLRHLGADVEYVISDLEPNVSTAQFTLGELALVSHFHDAILLTAAPLAAEGLTAHLDVAFIEDLRGLVASWGVPEPEKATRFLASHIDFDSGYDGHFEGSMRLLSEHLTDERALRRYLSALHAQMNSFLRIYRDGMDEAALWSR